MLNAHRNLYKSYIASLLSLHACRSNQKLVQQVSKPSQATKSASPKHLRKSNLKGIALGKHTDFGSVTVLFNRLGGLQVRLSTTFAAAQCYRENPLRERLDVYVRPLAGHCIVNVGDALVMFSNGMLWRNIHCVVAPPGEQGCVTRYSLVDLCRPEDDVVVLESMVEGAEQRGGESVMAKEWVLRGALGRREE